jgi:hypothetical protein
VERPGAGRDPRLPRRAPLARSRAGSVVSLTGFSLQIVHLHEFLRERNRPAATVFG